MTDYDRAQYGKIYIMYEFGVYPNLVIIITTIMLFSLSNYNNFKILDVLRM